MTKNDIINYLKHSGMSISIMLNPYHWFLVPYMKKEGETAWEQKTHRVSFLFFTVRFWIDDGRW